MNLFGTESFHRRPHFEIVSMKRLVYNASRGGMLASSTTLERGEGNSKAGVQQLET